VTAYLLLGVESTSKEPSILIFISIIDIRLVYAIS
jgi:hypothetical protein